MEDKQHLYISSATRFLNTPYSLITPAHVINGLVRIESKGYNFKREGKQILIERKGSKGSFFVRTYIDNYKSLRDALIATIGEFNHYYNII